MAINKNKKYINELFEKSLKIFLTDRKKYYEDINRPREVSKYESYNIIVNELPTLLENETNISKSQYIFKGSISTGNVSEIPWICIFDKDITESAEDGYYIVFLFQANMKGVYLSLNQGVTKYTNEYGNKIGSEKIKANTNKYQKLLKNTDGYNKDKIVLYAKTELGKGYEAGNICSKYYSVENFPDDNELVDDLRKLIGIYKELKKQLISTTIESEIKIDEEEFQEEIQSGKIVKLPEGRINKPEKKNRSISTSWPRSRNISFTALNNANFKCENDDTHVTFTTAKGHQFVEAHHLIPLEFQDNIDSSIDVPENIISLCPNCHRAFHNSTNKYKSSLISKFYFQRKELLNKREILINIDRLEEYYKIMSAKYVTLFTAETAVAEP